MPEQTNEEIVRAFVTGWGPAYADLRASYERYLADDCVWENPGMPPCKGKAEILALLDGAHQGMGIEATPVDLRNIAAAGPVVFTERMDRLIGADGKVILEGLAATGVFELRDGLIVAWRDYADPREFLSLMG